MATKKTFTDESLATFVDEIKSYTDSAVSTKANESHNHAASNITSGTLSSDRLPTVPITKGGTGATTAEGALTNLGITATAAELNKMDGVTATTTELNYVDGVTSNIQTQLNSKLSTSGTAAKATADASGNTITSTYETKTDASAKLDEAKEYTDTVASGKADSSHTHAISEVTNLQSSLDGKVPTSRTINGKALSGNITLSASDVGASESGHTHSSYVNQNAFSNVKVGSTTVAADTTTDTLEIAAGTGITVSGDATNDKVTISNSGVRSISTGSGNGTISVNTNGSSVDVAVKGLGSAAYTASTAYDAAGTAQTKADAALSSAKSYTDTSISNLINSAPTTLDTLGEIATAMQTNEDVVEALEAAVGNKQDKITGGASTIVSSNLTTNRALISNGSGKVAVSDITSTELSYLDGVTSSIQTQLNNKVSASALNSYYTKTEIDALELITVDDIDTICGTTIQIASEVTF